MIPTTNEKIKENNEKKLINPLKRVCSTEQKNQE